ncbi:hypothetical protein EHI47_38525 [Rhizobium leguminosarum]|uniref:Uncharacterized protein n=1 Tax=Rhizobium leguminosarum TaxID=384 RepID=A0A444HHH3_RHILE|nr:hypothetical protein EHI47_38525 [Rhizobium leguminosarum]
MMKGVPCGPLIRPFGPPSPRWGEEEANRAAPGRAEFNRSAKTTSVLATGIVPRCGLLARHAWQVSWLAVIGRDRGRPETGRPDRASGSSSPSRLHQ